MLVIISDLHLEEERSRNIESQDSDIDSLNVTRNVSPRAFRKIFTRWDKQAESTDIDKMDLVLAGDIFDLHRTALWFQGDDPDKIRPYVRADESEINNELEGKVIEILNEINAPGSRPHEILEMFRELSSEGTYVDENGDRQTFHVPKEDIRIHYFPGNHDRLANGTPSIRRKVRELLGIGGDGARFQPYLTFDEERALVRHGQEYDRYNFSTDVGRQLRRKSPLKIDDSDYAEPTFGDFVTVDIASRLSQEFRWHYSDEKILKDQLLRSAYERIIEFDDLRPQVAALNYLLRIPTSGKTSKYIWKNIYAPVIIELFNKVHKNRFLAQSLKQLDRWGFDSIDAIQGAIATRAWERTLESYRLINWLSDLATEFNKGSAPPEQFAAREKTILDGSYLFVVAGHTHHPIVEFIGGGDHGEQFYVNTGTWRRRIYTNGDFSAFGRVKALTYAIIYGPEEDVGRSIPAGQAKVASLDFWSGVTERWFKRHTI